MRKTTKRPRAADCRRCGKRYELGDMDARTFRYCSAACAARPTTRAALIDAILTAARRPVPDVARIIEIGHTDGVWRRVTANSNVPTTGESRIAGYALRDPVSGCTYGTMQRTADEVRAGWNASQDADTRDFRSKLEEMDDARIESQADYWLGQSVPATESVR